MNSSGLPLYRSRFSWLVVAFRADHRRLFPNYCLACRGRGEETSN